MVKLLKEMLFIEAKDKEFLLANITRITQNNGKYIFVSFRTVQNRLHFTKKSSRIQNIFIISLPEWLLEDFKQSQFLHTNHKTSDRHTENGFSDRANGRYSFQIDNSCSKLHKTHRISMNSRSINKGKIFNIITQNSFWLRSQRSEIQNFCHFPYHRSEKRC